MRFIFTLATLLLSSLSPASAADPVVVPAVDYSRYVGLWYEIGHYPNFFQTECVRSTAEYAALENGRVSVLNTCYREAKAPTTIKGVAFAQNPAEPAKLKVDFGFPFLGDYWIIDLDPEYQWAVVSGPGKKSLFILARQAPMSDALLQPILARLAAQGFDLDKIIYDKY
jgi:apolipoprotein D and lipocalin family protein